MRQSPRKRNIKVDCLCTVQLWYHKIHIELRNLDHSLLFTIIKSIFFLVRKSTEFGANFSGYSRQSNFAKNFVKHYITNFVNWEKSLLRMLSNSRQHPLFFLISSNYNHVMYLNEFIIVEWYFIQLAHIDKGKFWIELFLEYCTVLLILTSKFFILKSMSV